MKYLEVSRLSHDLTLLFHGTSIDHTKVNVLVKARMQSLGKPSTRLDDTMIPKLTRLVSVSVFGITDQEWLKQSSSWGSSNDQVAGYNARVRIYVKVSWMATTELFIKPLPEDSCD